jgi:hypothetical protein
MSSRAQSIIEHRVIVLVEGIQVLAEGSTQELGLLELVDAVRARHVTPVISIYCIVVAEPYFAGFRSA